MSAHERLFARMWAAAALAHLAGNPFYGDVWPRPSAVGVRLPSPAEAQKGYCW